MSTGDNVNKAAYDAVLIVSFGGPEKRQDVMPFLENVVRGKNVPRARLLEVAEHYYRFDGKSPINDHVRELMKLLRAQLDERHIALAIYWGNRNWHPLLVDTVAQMAADGVKRALAFVTSAYSSYSSCRQYLEDIERARQPLGDQAPTVDKVRLFFNHPLFVAANVDRLREALERIPAARRSRAHVVCTAHSIPASMAASCDYAKQLDETTRLVCDALDVDAERRSLVFQSRSGPPRVPWLEPDVNDHLRSLKERGAQDVVILPIGFLSDHMEVLYDLDVEAQRTCDEMGLNMVRAAAVGTHPQFVAMAAELIAERVRGAPGQAIGALPAWPDVCPADCCPPPVPARSRPG